MHRTLALLRGLAALLVLVGLAAGVPWLLVVIVGNPLPAEGLWLSGRLTENAILGLLAVLGWIAWAQFVACVGIEAVAEVRHALGESADWLSKVPGTFNGQQQVARLLVHAVTAAVVGTSTTQLAGPSPVAAVAVPSPMVEAEPRASTPKSQERPRPAREVLVARGDTLWSLAEQHLGEGERWRSIADLNAGRTMADGQRFLASEAIHPGWRLLIPADDPPARAERSVVVERGDTLWDLSEEQYGDGQGWPRIYRANRDHISDPDVIYPGQVLDVPGQGHTVQPRHHGAAQTEPRERPESQEQESSPSPPAPTTAPPTGDPAVTERATAEPDATEVRDVPDDGAEGLSLVTALTGGGALLGAGLVSLLLVRRRMQYRVRRSGRMVAQTPGEWVPAEKAIRAGGSDGLESAEFLDLALRELASAVRERNGALPDVVAARLSDDQLDLHLASPPHVPLPKPWQEDSVGLVVSRSRLLHVQEVDALAPYPTLVSVGVDDAGGTWLIDLEAAGIVQLAGEPDGIKQVARFMVMDLGVNVWSDHVAVTVGEFARELTALSPGRIRVAGDVALEDLVTAARDVVDSCHVTGQDVLAGRADGGAAETLMPTVAFLQRAAATEPELSALRRELDHPPGRKAAALVVVGGEESIDGPTLLMTLDHDGWMTMEPLGVKVDANRVSATDASKVAALIAHHREAEDQPMLAALGDREYEQLSDAAGGLREQHTGVRDAGGEASSPLPEADEKYIVAAATTSEDLAVLAPQVPRQVSDKIRALDPTLADDLAAWHDRETTRPRIRVLGPVELLVPDQPQGDARTRRAHAAEVVAYLATHPQGVTTEQLAYDFGVQERVVHNYISAARQWVGVDPGTGASYIPDCTKTEASRTRGMGVYQVVGVLSDEDLFRRLRVRSQAHGPDGVDDLIAALHLVEGRPFDQLRKRGYGWLAETPLDHQLTAAIVDVAHIVATRFLAEGDHGTAIWAAETAILAAPAEEKPKLDLAAGLEARGAVEEASRYVDDAVRNRADDGGPPPDLQQRTRRLLGE